MNVFRSVTIGTTVLALTAAGLVVLASPATAQPCGIPDTGSSGSSGLGSSGFTAFGSTGSSGYGSYGNQPPEGRQGPLPVIASANTNAVEWVTGPRSNNSTFNRFGISGTDLALSWDNGSGQILMAFGDTFGNCSIGGQEWRHNVLLRSDDTDLSNGITLSNAVPGDARSGSVVTPDRTNFGRELIPAIGFSYIETTTIPTAAISIGNTQYINYMSIRSWGAPGQWFTNFSAISVSHDNGQTWSTDGNTIRANVDLTIPGVREARQGNDKFQMSSYLKGNDGYIYQYGTPNGRSGATYLARFLPQDILDLNKYEYFTNDAAARWSTDASNLAAVAPQPTGELSVAWNEYLKRYVMLNYSSDPGSGILIRTAENPEGPWSGPKLLAPGSNLGGVYAPFIHPWSSGKYLYYTASVWKDYNVMLLRTDLSRI
ncbi:UNVERIFIED_CONTAM: uncharacterized protein DUF4185 [Williamsia faeni]